MLTKIIEETIYKNTKLTRKDANSLSKLIIDEALNSLCKGETLSVYGKFSIRPYLRSSRVLSSGLLHIGTGVQIPATWCLKLRTNRSFREEMNKALTDNPPERKQQQ